MVRFQEQAVQRTQFGPLPHRPYVSAVVAVRNAATFRRVGSSLAGSPLRRRPKSCHLQPPAEGSMLEHSPPAVTGARYCRPPRLWGATRLPEIRLFQSVEAKVSGDSGDSTDSEPVLADQLL